jgi:SAM-dependent methyltransferase
MPDRWNRIAATRRRQIEAGLDLTFTRLFVPYYEDLVRRLRPSSLLEVGCGTGHLVSVLSNHIDHVVALEPSRGMREVARQVLHGTSVQLEPVAVEDFRGQDAFDLIVSHLCAQVVADLTSFVAAIVRHMHSHSRLVLAIPHPCFYNDYKHFIPPDEYAYMKKMGRTISFTITKEPDTPISGVPYYHRPLNLYFAALAAQGLCILQFHEMYPTPELEQEYGTPWRVPRYCTFDCERAKRARNNREQSPRPCR